MPKLCHPRESSVLRLGAFRPLVESSVLTPPMSPSSAQRAAQLASTDSCRTSSKPTGQIKLFTLMVFLTPPLCVQCFLLVHDLRSDGSFRFGHYVDRLVLRVLFASAPVLLCDVNECFLMMFRVFVSRLLMSLRSVYRFRFASSLVALYVGPWCPSRVRWVVFSSASHWWSTS